MGDQERYLVLSDSSPPDRYLRLSVTTDVKEEGKKTASTKLSIPPEDKASRVSTKLKEKSISRQSAVKKGKPSKQSSQSGRSHPKDKAPPAASGQKTESKKSSKFSIHYIILYCGAGHALCTVGICLAAYLAMPSKQQDVITVASSGKLIVSNDVDYALSILNECIRSRNNDAAYESTVSCAYLSQPLYFNCSVIMCQKPDFQFSVAEGRFKSFPLAVMNYQPKAGARCAEDPSYTCVKSKSDPSFTCTNQEGRQLNLTTPLGAGSNISGFIDNCGKPDTCTIYSGDPFIRALIVRGKPDFLDISSCTHSPDTCENDYRDAIIHVRFLRCALKYTHGDRYCRGSPIRFVICHKCPTMFYLPSIFSPYWDFNMCGPMNYHFSAGCQVRCLDKSSRTKPNGRLCQPMAKHFDYFDNIYPAKPEKKYSDSGDYFMCFQGECVEVYEQGDPNIVSKHCSANPQVPPKFKLPAQKESTLTFADY